MTSFNKYDQGRDRDQQDGMERHVFGDIEYTAAGAMHRARGTGTEDVEVPVVNLGIGMNFSKDTNTEVFLLSMGSDTNAKVALITIPRDKQRPWKEGTGGIQNPTDPNKAFEFNAKRAHVTDPNFAIGEGLFEVIDGKIYIRADVIIGGRLTANTEVVTPTVSAGTATVPGFEA